MEYIKHNPKIFIICGKARSGKNTVADIITNNTFNSIELSITKYLKEYIKMITDWDGTEETKPRTLLQSFGIDLIKRKINNDLLINRTIEDIEVLSYFKDNIIITGVRLQEEINELKKHFNNNIIVIKVIRFIDNKLSTKEKNHITEIDLDNYISDYEVINNNYSELKENILKIIKEVENGK